MNVFHNCYSYEQPITPYTKIRTSEKNPPEYFGETYTWGIGSPLALIQKKNWLVKIVKPLIFDQRSEDISFSNSLYLSIHDVKSGHVLKNYQIILPLDKFSKCQTIDLDKILISYGNEDEKQIKKQIDSVTDKACIQSEKCPERGLPTPEASCSSNEICTVG